MSEIELSISVLKLLIAGDIGLRKGHKERIFPVAIQALREQQERENPEPLTLEQLREHNCDWVWIVLLADYPESVAKYVNGYGYVIGRYTRVRVVDRSFDFEDYGKTWIAYAYRPNVEARQIPKVKQGGDTP